MKNNCIYFAEGKCEAVLLNVLKEYPALISPGRIRVFNVVSHLIPRSLLVTIQTGTTVVLVFDTDVQVTKYLKKNIEMLCTYCNKTTVVFLPQVMNLEDELVRCTNVKNVMELTGSRSNKDFKRDFCVLRNCREVLNRHQTDVLHLWTHAVPETFCFVPANSNLIKL